MQKVDDVRAYINRLKPTWVGKLLYYVFPFRKKVVLQNMSFVFAGQLSAKEIIKLAQCFYSHLARSLRENIMLRFMSPQQICQQAEVIGTEKIALAAQQEKGVIVLTGHFGNWEFAPIAGIMNFKEYQGRFHFVRRTLRNKFIEKMLFRRFYQAGLQVIPKKNSLSHVCDALDLHDIVVFIMDQHANIAQRDGIVAEFFGREAGTFRSLAMIARYTQVPVVPATCYRRADGKHVLQFFDPVAWTAAENAKQEIYINTLGYNKVLEKMVLAHPEQWLWMHKRWKINSSLPEHHG